MKTTIKKIPGKQILVPSIKIIIINNSTLQLTDASDNTVSPGFGNIYELRLHPALIPGGSGVTSPAGGWIVWCCNQPFTFLAFDTTQWGGNNQGWNALGLWNGNGYSTFAAVNSLSLSTNPPTLPLSLPAGNSYYLPLMALGKKGDTCNYSLMIPQQDLNSLPAVQKTQAPPANGIVRATIILQ